MSLFSSAFEQGLSAGPSTSLSLSTKKSHSHKRKRPSLGDGKDDQIRATQQNLEKLMKAVEKGGLDKKHPSLSLDAKAAPHQEKKVKSERRIDGFSEPSSAGPSLGKKRKGDKGHAGASQPKAAQSGAPSSKKKKVPYTPVPPPSSKDDETAGLTSLQKGMKAKLEGARFRWINEQLYSTPSTEAVAMMKQDPKIFSDYHMTHRVLTSAWPSPPLPYIVDLIDPLPAGTVIADLGCGDAGLARELVPTGKVVLSYDLVGDNGILGSQPDGEGWVVQADFLTSVPLPGRPGGNDAVAEEKGGRKSQKAKETGSEVIDVVVCCLSLMGTNWVGGIYEACRILKQGGTFHVAEVTSRFTSTPAFVNKVKSFGFELENEESPSTHFTLFRFVKTAAVPVGPVRGQLGWDERVKEGEGILQPCVYKKR